MATRFYFPDDGHNEEVTPSSWSTGWDKTTGTASRKLLAGKTAVIGEVNFANTTSGTSGHFTAVRRYISGPLGAQTISGTVKGQFKVAEAASTDNCTIALAIKIIQSDGSDRAVLLAVTASDDTSTTPPEMAVTTRTNRPFLNSSESASISLTSQDASYGDRLVVEVGMRQASTAVSNIQWTAQATAGTADLPEDNTTTTALNPWIEFSDDITFTDVIGSMSNPVDTGSATNTADPTVINIDSEITARAGDLVVIIGQQRASAATLAISEAGGQTWNTLNAVNATNQTARVFWCTFNGTWSADPSVDFSATTCNSVQAFVFRPETTSHSWSVNQALVELDFTGTLSPTITGQTTTGTDPTVTLAGWFTADDNTWGSISGTGWTVLGGPQYRNTSGSDQSATYALKTQSAAGATGNVTKTQLTLGDDPGTSFIVTFSAAATTAHAGAAIFSGDSTLSVLAENPKIGAATLAGNGTLSAYANLNEQIAATLNGTSTLFVQYFVADIQGGLGYWFNGVPFVGLVGQNTDTRGLKYWFNGVSARYLLGEEVAGVHQGEARFNGAGSLSVLATLNEAAATTQPGAGALSITANLNEAAAATFNGDSTLSALAVFSTVTHQGAATFNGNSTLSVETQKSKTAEATFNGDSTLTIATAKSKTAEATFSGDGSLSVAARLNEQAAATFSGAGNLSTYANLNERAAATLNGESTLSALAVFSGAVQQGAATFNGNSTLSMLAENPKIGAATFPGAGSLSAAVTLGEAAAATLNGDSTLSIATQKSKQAEAIFNGAGSLSVLARLVQPAFATYAGQGSLSELATLNERAAATFNGSSTLSANAIKAGIQEAAATFPGAGNLSITARLNERAAATLGGAGSLFVTVIQVDRAAATLNGVGSLSVTASKHIAATFAGNSSLSARAQLQERVDIVLTGASTLRVEAQLLQAMAANFNGTGALLTVAEGGIVPRSTTSRRARYSNLAQAGRSNLAPGKRTNEAA